MSRDVQIRRAIEDDFLELGNIFHEAIRFGATQYTEAQRAAWSPAPPRDDAWHEHLASQLIWIAEEAGRSLGFLTLRPDGYVDLAYIRPNATRSGTFAKLYAVLEIEAARLHLPRLWTDASLHAKGPFESVGFRLVAPETVIRNGEAFKRFQMEKILNV